jgi:outer membrane protein assembly factor BamB
MVLLTTSRLVVALATAGAVTAGLLLWGSDAHEPSPEWSTAAGNLAATRAAPASGISTRNVDRLRVRWRFRFSASSTSSNIDASTPVADAKTVYVQDLHDVFALDRVTGDVRWTQRFRVQSGRANGLTVDAGRVYGQTDSNVFALGALNGRELWRRRLASARRQLADSAPVTWKGVLFVSTVDPERPGHETLYALDAATGVVRWKFAPLETPRPVSIDAEGRLYTASGLVLDARSGRLLRHWSNRLGTTPILARSAGNDAAFAAAKSGLVTAWDPRTEQQFWDRRHTGCRGVERAMAYADDRLFVPVDLCGRGGELLALDAASGRTLWERHLPAPDAGCATVANDVVFTSTHDGTVYAFATRDGTLVWHVRLPAKVSACPAIVGDALVLRAGATLVALTAAKTTG